MSEQVISTISALAGLGIVFGLFIFLISIWSIVWKGYALWIAAQEENKPWFLVILILNTAGILEIIYIFLVSKKGKRYLEQWKAKRARQKMSAQEDARHNQVKTTTEEN